MTTGYDSLNLQTLSPEGKAPECRMLSAQHLQDFVRRMTDNDQKRNRKRSLVAGLIGGNPPYRLSKMRDANMAHNCNANWGTAFSYVEAGAGAFYDLFSEAPGVVGVRTSFGKDEIEREAFSRILSAEADRTMYDEQALDYHMQQSQWEMTLYGCGPLFFEDMFKCFPRSGHCGDLKVPERTKADVRYFEVASVDVDYYPPELYDFIRNEKAAKAAGWNIEYTRKAISLAMEIRQSNDRLYDWEFYQQELKNSSLSYYDDSKVIKAAICWWKEFNGKITQAIIERDSHATGETEYLFLHVNRYDNWYQALHPMYFDRGNGGFHHSVTGLGTRLYGPMEHENRLLCNLFDKAYAPDLLFRPTTTESTQKFALSHMSQYGILPANWEVQQSPVKGFVSDGLAMFQTSSELMRSNLSVYRQRVPPERPGNPPTKYQKSLEASQASSLSKTTFNRYYKQLDALYAEIVRRMCNTKSPDRTAKDFQERCKLKGVPVECFSNIESVKAVRVVGEGSAFLRRESVVSVGQIVGSLPEEGRQRWTDDFIASHCGQEAVGRYNPKPLNEMQKPDEQDERISNQIAGMKVGMPPVINSSQNALKFAAAFLAACVQAIQSVQQGADMGEVVKFLDLCAPACMAHLKRIVNDQIRKPAVKEIMKQLEQVSRIADRMRQALAKQAQQRAQQEAKTQAALSDQALKAQEVQGKLAIAGAKAKQQMDIKQAKAAQDLALADARTSSDIILKTRSEEAKEGAGAETSSE